MKINKKLLIKKKIWKKVLFWKMRVMLNKWSV